MPKGNVKSKVGPTVVSERKMSPELKIAGFVVLILGVLLAYDYISNPEETTQKVSSAAGNIVADVQDVVQDVQKVVKDEPAPVKKITEVKILSPAKGSTQTGEFVVKIQVPSEGALCYYQIKDSGSTTFDRRTRNCGQDLVIKEAYCKTKGANTCYVYYSASNSGDSVVYGSDEAYFSIE